MSDWHTVVWLDDKETENFSIQMDLAAALREAAALLRQGRSVTAIQRGQQTIMDAAAVRERCLP
jgi:hypothetical protein